MIYFFYGLGGALCLLLLLAGGFLLGWFARGSQGARLRREQAEELTEKQKRELRAEQDAFRQLLGYNIDVAYGVRSPVQDNMGGDDR